MGFIQHSKTSKSFLVLATLIFVLVGIFGLSHFGMTNSKDQMATCPFMGMAALCQMSPLEHIAAWQSMFTTIPQKDNTSMLLVILLVSGLLALVSRFSLFQPPGKQTESWLYLKQHPDLNTFDPLRTLFSQGILNPKTY